MEPDNRKMEQVDTNHPDKKMTLGELCEDIFLRAEKMCFLSNKEKYILLIIALVFLVLVVLDWHYKWFKFEWFHWCSLACLGAIVVIALGYIINRKLINGMKRAASPKQHLRLAKWLKWSVQTRNALGAIILWLPLVRQGTFEVVLLIVVLVFILGFLSGKMDSAFCSDLDELEYRLDV